MEKVIGNIRNVLRKEGITGMDSINHCITFLVCRLLDEELCNKIGIPTKYSFNSMMYNEDGKEVGDQELYDKFCRKNSKKCFVFNLVNKLKFTNIKFKLVGIHNLKKIMKKLQELDINNLAVQYDLIGTIYEIHLKSGTSNSMRDLGQYYTHRLVIKYMIELCDIQMIDGLIEKTVDPTMGTGGFLTMAIKHLNQKYDNIDWSKNKDSIIGFDIDDNVKNMALLNVFLEIGELCTNTIVKQDTLHNDLKFDNDGSILEKAKVILANEPMGLKNITHASCCDRIKDMKIRGTKAEPLFLQLFMEALDEGGRCAVIVPDGVLFNESNLHKNTRKHLIENFNLKKVISLNDDKFFLNTGVKTSILFFSNDEHKTEKVNFCEITIDENEEIKETSVIDVNYDKIKEFDYSLFVNKYNVEEMEKIEGMEYKKLGEVCDFLKKSKRKASYGKDKGKYPFYTSSSKIKRCDEVDYKDECIIIGTGGKANIKYNNKFSCSSDNFILKTNNKNNNIKYLYYYFLYNIHLLENGFSGSTIKHVSKSYIKDLEIPIPSLQKQKEIVKRLDVLSENNNTLEKNIDEFKKIMNYYVDCHTRLCDEYKKLKNILKKLPKGKRKSKEGKTNGKYPLYYCSILRHLWLNEYDFEEEGIMINTTNGSGKCEIFYCKDKYSVAESVLRLNSNSKEILTKYVYYYLKTIKYKIESLFKGSNQKQLSKSDFLEIEIPIPSLQIQNKIVEYCDNLSNMIDNMEKQIIENKNLMKNILGNHLNINQEITEQIEQDIEDKAQQLVPTNSSIEISEQMNKKI